MQTNYSKSKYSDRRTELGWNVVLEGLEDEQFDLDGTWYYRVGSDILWETQEGFVLSEQFDSLHEAQIRFAWLQQDQEL